MISIYGNFFIEKQDDDAPLCRAHVCDTCSAPVTAPTDLHVCVRCGAAVCA